MNFTAIRNLLICQKVPRMKDSEIPICFSRTSHFGTLHMITRKHSSRMRTAHLFTGKRVVVLSRVEWGGMGVLLSRGWRSAVVQGLGCCYLGGGGVVLSGEGVLSRTGSNIIAPPPSEQND